MRPSLPASGIDTLTKGLLDEIKPRAKSLIVTVWGDSILRRGGSVWLGGLIELMAPFGVNQRLVRTSVLRLTREDWCVSSRVGRRSLYRLTENGRQRFEDAHRRIFADAEPAWDGRWSVVFTGLGELPGAARDRLRRELLWLGFGAVAANVFAHPAADEEALRHVLGAPGVAGQTAVMSARSEHLPGGVPAHELLRRSWDLEGLSAAYRQFVGQFRPIRSVLERFAPTPVAGFVLRTLLVHEYRRVLLRAPDLPGELLPPDWAGTAARSLRDELHRRLKAPADRHVARVLDAGAAAGEAASVDATGTRLDRLGFP